MIFTLSAPGYTTCARSLCSYARATFEYLRGERPIPCTITAQNWVLMLPAVAVAWRGGSRNVHHRRLLVGRLR